MVADHRRIDNLQGARSETQVKLVDKTRVSKVDALTTTSLRIYVTVEAAQKEEVAELGRQQVTGG